MKKILLLITVLSILSGCKEENKNCIKSHTELKIMFYPTANGQLNQIMVPYVVCDEYEKEEK